MVRLVVIVGTGSTYLRDFKVNSDLRKLFFANVSSVTISILGKMWSPVWGRTKDIYSNKCKIDMRH